MAGLLSEAPPREEMPDEAGSEQASPEEQQQYEMLFKNGWRLIADEQGKPRKGVLEMLDPDPTDLKSQLGEEALAEYGEQLDPAVALGSTVASILVRLASSAKQAGQQLLPAALVEAGKDLLADLAQLGEKNGLGPYDDKAMERAVIVAAGVYGKAAKDQGLVTDEDLAGDVAAMQDADQSGKLSQMVGGGEAAPEGEMAQ